MKTNWKKYFVILFGILLTLAIGGTDYTYANNMEKPEDESIYIIGSIHYDLQKNEQYSMQFLLDSISALKPDIIAIEVLPEDIGLSYDEMNEQYTPEFAEINKNFSDKAQVIGFNWIPEEQRTDRWGYREKGSALYAEMMEDPAKSGEKQLLVILTDTIKNLVATASAYDINSRAFDAMALMKQGLVRSIIENTEHADYLYYSGDINPDRLENMHQNAKSIIEANQDKRILFVTGALHRGHMIQYIQETYPNMPVVADLLWYR